MNSKYIPILIEEVLIIIYFPLLLFEYQQNRTIYREREESQEQNEYIENHNISLKAITSGFSK